MARAKPKFTVITPSKDEVVKVVSSLQRSLKTNRGLATKFQSSPRGVLGALGLNEDLQSQLLHEAGIAERAEGCKFTCLFTCEISCIFTNINL